MSLIGLLFRNGPSGFGFNSTADEVTAGRALAGKTFVVTGCNGGLGAETMRVLGARGARVVGTARTLEKARQACAAVAGSTVPLACDLSEPASVRAAVATLRELGPLDAIVANAGIMALPRPERKHGYELQFLTNHVGHYVLVTGLLDRLAPDGRVVMLSSDAHKRAYAGGVRLDDLSAEKGYSPWGAYGQSKLCNLLFARELARRLPAGQTAYGVHPGVIATNLSSHLPTVHAVLEAVRPLFLKTPAQGAATQCYVATSPDVTQGTGQYWADCNLSTPSAKGRDDALAKALWAASEKIAATI